MFRNLPYIAFVLLLGAVHASGQIMTIDPLPWNTEFNEFAPAIYGDQIVYCSDRPSQLGVKWLDESGRQPYKLYISGDADSKRNQFFNPEINTRYHEGPACFNSAQDQFLYSGTISSPEGNKNYALGIFICSKVNGKWQKPVSFKYNSQDASYQVTNPMLSLDGSILYFSSDMPGTKGGQDIFYCKLTSDGWSEPENMGDLVNTSANETYPFADEFNNFFFSSNRDASRGMDIFQCRYNKDHYLDPQPLSEPMNSAFDDFAYISTKGGELGYFSSNRNGSGDDIFKFEYTYPTFEGCPPAEQPTFCYYFEETNIVPNDSMKFIYEWELGDGNTAAGLSTEHCYKDFGQYHIALNVYDSLTKVKFARVSELDLEITKSPFPWIAAPDSSGLQGEIAFSATGTDIEDFEPREYYWHFGDGRHSRGFSTTHQFLQEGFYEVQLGIIGLNKTTQTEEKRCSTKRITIGSPEPITSEDTNETIPSILQQDMVFSPEENSELLLYVPDSTIYYIQFHESREQMSLDDPYFNNIKYEITERFYQDETLFKYSVGNTTDPHVMLRIYNDLKDKGYDKSLIRETKSEEFDYATTKKWWYFADSLASAINKHLNKFNDIQFAKDDYRIREASYDNLDYISQVLIMEPEMKLKIMAHTDSIGTSEHNMKLSTQRAQEVLKYFVGKGIDSNRLSAVGYGEEMPLVSNSTEEGRSVNRRVSFEIVLEDPKK